MTSEVILVDEFDYQIGTMEKLEAHRKGFLHRAFSVFLFNKNGELLLQQRAHEKYHSGGLWSNTCCSHPRPGKILADEVNNRLFEEMGIRCQLNHVFSFTYTSSFENGLIENEFDHVFFGITEQEPIINKSEVRDWKFMNLSDLSDDLKTFPEKYTQWLQKCFHEINIHFEKNKKALFT